MKRFPSTVNKIPVQSFTIKDGKKIEYNFYFDTGAGLCFLMNEAFTNNSAILMKHRKPVLVQTEGLGGKLQMQLTVIKSTAFLIHISSILGKFNLFFKKNKLFRFINRGLI